MEPGDQAGSKSARWNPRFFNSSSGALRAPPKSPLRSLLQLERSKRRFAKGRRGLAVASGAGVLSATWALATFFGCQRAHQKTWLPWEGSGMGAPRTSIGRVIAVSAEPSSNRITWSS